MSLTRNEAKALLDALATLTVGEILDNTDLVNALICLKQIAKTSTVTDNVFVKLTMTQNDKVAAIKVFRILTGTGLKEAKDAIDRVWPTRDHDVPFTLPLGHLSRNEFEAGVRTIKQDTWINSRVTLEATTER